MKRKRAWGGQLRCSQPRGSRGAAEGQPRLGEGREEVVEEEVVVEEAVEGEALERRRSPPSDLYGKPLRSRRSVSEASLKCL